MTKPREMDYETALAYIRSHAKRPSTRTNRKKLLDVMATVHEAHIEALLSLSRHVGVTRRQWVALGCAMAMMEDEIHRFRGTSRLRVVKSAPEPKP